VTTSWAHRALLGGALLLVALVALGLGLWLGSRAR
jgi:hypothetical protein